MLQKLVIRNYAIIDHLIIEPDKHLNTVTGETGAGKSIILGALSLILGERADTSVLINKSDKCVVEAWFDVSDNIQFKNELHNEELDEDDQCIIRREISTAGKSRAFVNDTPVTLAVLNRLTSLLVDLHQQFGHLELQEDHFQMDVVDAIAKNLVQRNKYQEQYREYKKLNQQLSAYRNKQAEWQKEADYKQFLFDELAQAAFKDDEIEHAEQELKKLTNAERIISVLQSVKLVLEEGEQPLVNELKRINQQLQGIADVAADVAPLVERLASVHAELKDIAAELEGVERRISMNPETMQNLQERVDTGYKLCKKHGVRTTAELLKIQEQISGELQETLNLNDTIEQLARESVAAYNKLTKEAETLSSKRKEAIPGIADKVNNLLHLVGMPNARFKIELKQTAEPAEFGMDDIAFLLDANKSENYQPVYKAASGGEMSRIMLCIKSLTAQAMHLPTLIFDEVDTGISGEAAKQVGMLLQDLGQHRQVICITHQPQVAAKGERHFFVYKEQNNKDRINTNIRVLGTEERVLAIAQMIGGEKPSDAALQNARELVAVI